MDDIVRQAMAKWPKVPACFGWLGLDARGHWWMRDDRTQALGAFQLGGDARGSRLQHDKLIDFIGRNYAAETDGPWAGCWYFQNGPQRVYVELEVAPWIWRLTDTAAGLQLRSHSGLAASALQCGTDAKDRVWLHTELGWGLLHSQDVGLAAAEIEAGRWTLAPQPIDTAAEFETSPQARQLAARV